MHNNEISEIINTQLLSDNDYECLADPKFVLYYDFYQWTFSIKDIVECATNNQVIHFITTFYLSDFTKIEKRDT